MKSISIENAISKLEELIEGLINENLVNSQSSRTTLSKGITELKAMWIIYMEEDLECTQAERHTVEKILEEIQDRFKRLEDRYIEFLSYNNAAAQDLVVYSAYDLYTSYKNLNKAIDDITVKHTPESQS